VKDWFFGYQTKIESWSTVKFDISEIFYFTKIVADFIMMSTKNSSTFFLKKDCILEVLLVLFLKSPETRFLGENGFLTL